MSGRILKGPKKPIPKVTRSLGEQFAYTAHKFAELPFQIDAYTGHKETWSEILQKTMRVAIWLQNNGIKPNDIIVSCFPCNFTSSIPVLANILIGTRHCALDPTQDLNDVKYLLALLEPSVIFVDHESLKLFEEALKNVEKMPKIVVAGLTTDATTDYVKLEDIINTLVNKNETESFQPAKYLPGQTPLLFCTSGTTGYPKIACMPTESFASQSDQSLMIQIKTSTFYWISAILQLNYQIHSGSAVVSALSITAERYLELIVEHKIPFIIITPFMLGAIMKLSDDRLKSFDFSNVRQLNLIATIFFRFQIDFLKKYFPKVKMYNDYATTECGNTLGSFDGTEIDSTCEKKFMSHGLTKTNVEIKIVDPNTKELLPPNINGEILVKIPTCMAGYLKTPYNETFDKDGFFTTGDLGYYDDDGFIYVKGRVSLAFKYRNYRIYPANIEEVLLKHPQVDEAVVVGITNAEDTQWPAACVVLKTNANVTANELIEYVENNVSDHNRLRGGLNIVKSLPKTPSGKIQRRKIVEWFEVDK